MSTVAKLSATVAGVRNRTAASRSVLMALTGIDGCGKGFVASRLASALADLGLRAGIINIDGWLNLPSVRFSAANTAEHFYNRAIRFDEMFAELVLPLRDVRSIRLDADFAEETATEYRRHVYAYDNLDVVVLEGIYLLKRELVPHYDLSVWIDCNFDTALERAVARAQEGLPPAETVRAYQTIYFPAQEVHFRRDAPRSAATTVLTNDPRLASVR